jgi:hypothetical protein
VREERDKINTKQAGAELCQAQTQVGLTAKAELILMMSSMDAVFHLFKMETTYKYFADSRRIRSSST